MKKALILLLTLATLLTCVIPVVAFAEGEGTPISTVAEFEAMDPQGNYYLTGDIDFGGKIYDKGHILSDFSGTLDGKGFCVFNFELKGVANAGMFQTLAAYKDTTIKNLQIGKPDQPTKSFATVPEGSALPYVGMLAARQYDSQSLLTIDNVDVYAEVTTEKAVANLNVGGIVGVVANCKITNCRMYGKVTSWTLTKHNNVAGIVSYIQGKGGTVENCYNFADIKIHTNHTLRAAGIVAYINTTEGQATIKGCVNYGSVYLDGTIYDGYRTVRYGLCSGIVSDIQREGSTIDSCINFGSITNDGKSDTNQVSGSSGILAWNYKINTVKNCYNYGKLSVCVPDATKDNEKMLVDGICMMNENIDAIFENNFDFRDRAEASTAVKAAGVQNTAPKNNRTDVRFLATVDALTYDAVGFDVVATYYRSGELYQYTLPLEAYHVYESISAGNASVTAAELGGSYIAAVSVKNIPTDGSVTFAVRSWAKKGDTTVYGELCSYVFRDGAFLLAETVA